jgi:tetratricopeptide (TPR) repeat protein
MSDITVFISYSHDSDEHREQVLALSNRLRDDGIQTRLDRHVNGAPEEGWPRWMLNQLDAAQFVLVVCTETYYRRFRGYEEPDKGKGVDWEGALITQELYDSRSKTLKFVPVFLNAAVGAHIPEPLRSTSYYALTAENNYQNLYDFLLGQAGVEPHPVGTLKPRPRQQGGVLTFDEQQPSEAAKIDISRIIKYAPAELIGRTAETQLLNDAWNKAVNGESKRPHVLTFVALGGEGKTSLVAKWAAQLAHDNWPGCEAVFAWSFYSQGTKEQTAASSDLFLKEALVFFGDAEMANSPRHASDKGKRLAQLVGAKCALLILDGVEPLQYAPTSPTPGELKDHGLSALLKGLAASSLGLCVVTTRHSIPDLKAYWQTTAPEIKLLRLSKEAGVALLKSLGVNGKQNEFEKLVEDVRGHALTLNLLGSYLHAAHAGDIRKRDLVKLEDANEEQGGHAFRVMDAYVHWFASSEKDAEENKKGQRALAVLRLLGLFDRPMSADCFAALLKAPAIPNLTELLVEKKEEPRRIAISRLEATKLLTVNRDVSGALLSLDTHPLLREYFAKQIREQHPGTWREAHRRIYKHLCATANEGEQPTLEALQPLYQAVVHGCLAGMQQEVLSKVYDDRILRGTKRDGFYSIKKLGAFGSDMGAIACFFGTTWCHASPALAEADQAWLLNQAAFTLLGLGRLTEAVKPMRAGVDMGVKQEEWSEAAIRTNNLSELELKLGELTAALSDAERSVTYADLGGDALWKMGTRTTHADTLHQAGQAAEAAECFRKAETMHADRDPYFPMLYSVAGFKYCDLLLSAAERAAWVMECGDVTPQAVAVTEKNVAASPYPTLHDVYERAVQTAQWSKENNIDLLSIALDHHTLSRAALYAVLLENASPVTCHASIQHAVDGLRRSGQQQFLPLGLLTRSWLHTLENNPDSAQADLDEALEIAERGPMPLFMADIYLHRARLFFRATPYPWHNPDGTSSSAKHDLAEARRLIEKHGYWRRKEELEDAERVILGSVA